MRLHDIAFYISAFFIVGIGLGSLKFDVGIILVLLALAIAGNFYFKKNWKIFVLAPAIFLGIFYYNFYVVWEDQKIPFNREISFNAIVSSDPNRGLEYQDFAVSLQDPWRGSVRVYTNLYPRFEYGDLLELSGKIEKSPSGKNIIGFPEASLINKNQGSAFKESLYKIKNSLVSNIQTVLPPDKSALASGILLGERAEFSEELKSAMQASGTTHIVALSGYNVSIISKIFFGYLLYVFSRRISFYLSLFIIAAFVLMTGAEPSVVRAAFMGGIMLLAEQSSRSYSFRNAITITAFIMLVIDPTLLVFDVGFEFSFLALMGLVYIEPFIRNSIVKFVRNKDKWAEKLKTGSWQVGLQTFSAQLAVAPVALHVFGYVSLSGLIANVLILQFIPLTMFLAFIVSVTGLVSGGLSMVISWILGVLLGYEIFIINFFSFNWL